MFLIWKQKISPALCLISFIHSLYFLALWTFQHGHDTAHGFFAQQFLGTRCFDMETYSTWTHQYMNFLTPWMLIVFPRNGTNLDVPFVPGHKYFLVMLSLCPGTRAKIMGQNYYIIVKKMSKTVKNCQKKTLFCPR